MGIFDELQNKASELLGGSDIGGSIEDATSGVQDAAQDATGGLQDAAAGLQDLPTDMQEQIMQYASDHNVSIEAAREHFLGGN